MAISYSGGKVHFHLWSTVGPFDLVEPESPNWVIAVALKHTTPAGTYWVVDTDETYFRVYADGKRVTAICKNRPCATSGWSYVNGNILLPYRPVNTAELAHWFMTDSHFKKLSAEEANWYAQVAMHAIRSGQAYDLTPLLKVLEGG